MSRWSFLTRLLPQAPQIPATPEKDPLPKLAEELPLNPIGEIPMSFNLTPEKLNTIAAAIQSVESIATTAVAVTGTAPTNEQKLNAALSIATAADPAIAPYTAAASVIISALVGIYNLFGVFKKKAAAPVAPAIAPLTAQ